MCILHVPVYVYICMSVYDFVCVLVYMCLRACTRVGVCVCIRSIKFFKFYSEKKSVWKYRTRFYLAVSQ